VLSECLSAHNADLACSSREDVVLAARIFDEVTGGLGLTLSVPKTKLLVTRIGLTDGDLVPLELDGIVVEVVDKFKYLGSLVEA